jgi:hypothetical protein
MDRSLDEILAERQQVSYAFNWERMVLEDVTVLTVWQTNRRGRGPRNDGGRHPRGGAGGRRGERHEYPRDGVRKVAYLHFHV